MNKVDNMPNQEKPAKPSKLETSMDERERIQRLQELWSKFMTSWSQLEPFPHKEASMGEYKQVQRLRELWSRSIMTWGQVFIPLGAVIIGFFASQAQVGTISPNFELLLIGWGLFTICMIYWRWVVHHLDEQIIGLYPVMLRLDSTNNWDTQTRYFFNNLANRSREYLRTELGLEHRPEDYDTFVEETRRQRCDHYSLLLSVWREYGRNSVADKGHKIQDIAVLIVIVLFLVYVLWIEMGGLALSSLLLFGFLFPWGQHSGWWTIHITRLWSSATALLCREFVKATTKAVKTGGKGKKRLSDALKKVRLQSQDNAGK